MKGLIFICLMATTALSAQKNSGTGTVSLYEGGALSINSDLVSITAGDITSNVFVPDTIKSLAFGPGAGEGAAFQFLLGSPVSWRNEVYFKTGANTQRNSLLLNIEFSDPHIKYISLGIYEREGFKNVDQMAFVSRIKGGYVKITSLEALPPNKEYLAVIFTQKEN